MTPQVSTISCAVAKTAPCWTSFSPAAGLRSLMYSMQVSTSRLAMADPIAPTPMNPTRSVMSLAPRSSWSWSCSRVERIFDDVAGVDPGVRDVGLDVGRPEAAGPEITVLSISAAQAA